MSKIIEACENLDLETMLTVVSNRGEEFVINSDRLAATLADLLSEEAHEEKMGWTISNAWFAEAFTRLKGAALSGPQPSQGETE